MAMLVFVIMEEDESSASQLKGSIDWQCTSLGRSYVVKTCPLRERETLRTNPRYLLELDCESYCAIVSNWIEEFCGHRLEDKSRHSESSTLVLLPSSTLVEIKTLYRSSAAKLANMATWFSVAVGTGSFRIPRRSPVSQFKVSSVPSIPPGNRSCIKAQRIDDKR